MLWTEINYLYNQTGGGIFCGFFSFFQISWFIFYASVEPGRGAQGGIGVLVGSGVWASMRSGSTLMVGAAAQSLMPGYGAISLHVLPVSYFSDAEL